MTRRERIEVQQSKEGTGNALTCTTPVKWRPLIDLTPYLDELFAPASPDLMR